MLISNLLKIAESSPNRWKTLWEKEKLLVTRNFSFSLSVFKRLVLRTRKNKGLFEKGLTNKIILDWSKLKAFADDKRNRIQKLTFIFGKGKKNSEKKEKKASNQHFLLFPQRFLKRFFPSWSIALKIV